MQTRKTFSIAFIAGLPRARSARGTEPHTHRIWSTSFRLVVTWLTERTIFRSAPMPTKASSSYHPPGHLKIRILKVIPLLYAMMLHGPPPPGNYCTVPNLFVCPWFRHRTFHEPNHIHWIRFMKSSASESIRNDYFNLERLSHSSLLARPGISPLERLWNGLDADDKLFMCRT